MNNTEVPAALKRIDVKAILRKRGIYTKTNHQSGTEGGGKRNIEIEK